MSDPYLSIPLPAFERTFEELLTRPDCNEERRQALLRGLAEFRKLNSKEQAMQSLLSAFPQLIVIPAMTEHVKAIGQQAAQQQQQQQQQAGPRGPSPFGGVGQPRPQGGAGLTPQQQQQHQILTAQQHALLLQQQRQQGQVAPRPVIYSNQTMGLRPVGPIAAVPTPSAQIGAGVKRPREGEGPQSESGADAQGSKQGAAGKAGGEEEGGDGIPRDADALNDVGFAIEEEQNALMASSRAGARQIRSLRDVALPRHLLEQEPVVNPQPLLQRMQQVAARQGLGAVDPQCVPYLAQAVEAHMGRLLTAVARVATQRTDPSRRYEGAVPVPSKRQPTPSNTDASDPSSGDGKPSDAQPAPAPARPARSHQSMLVFRKTRPLLIKMEMGDTGGLSTYFAGLARPLEPTTLLSPPASATSSSAAVGGGRRAGATPLALHDLVSTLERDTLLSKHPLVWRLHHKLAAGAAAE